MDCNRTIDIILRCSCHQEPCEADQPEEPTMRDAVALLRAMTAFAAAHTEQGCRPGTEASYAEQMLEDGRTLQWWVDRARDLIDHPRSEVL